MFRPDSNNEVLKIRIPRKIFDSKHVVKIRLANSLKKKIKVVKYRAMKQNSERMNSSTGKMNETDDKVQQNSNYKRLFKSLKQNI